MICSVIADIVGYNMNKSTKDRIIELLPYHSQAEIASMLNTSKGYVSKIKFEYLESCPEGVIDKINANRQRGKSRKNRFITDEMAKQYFDYSMTVYEITRLLDMSYPTVMRQMASHGYKLPTVIMRSQMNVIDRRAWLQKVGYSFDEAKLMQPDFVEMTERELKARPTRSKIEKISDMAIHEGKKIVERNPWLYRPWVGGCCD